MFGHRVHSIAILHFSLILCLCCYSCRGRAYRRPEFCDPPVNLTDDRPLSFLWSVKRHPPAFLFGTIHVPYSRVWDHIPENMKRAFESSENVFFELDLTDPATISALTRCQLLPAGERLSDILPRDLYRRLQRHLDYVKGALPSWMTADQRGRGLYADYLFNALTGNWERKRPVWVMMMVNTLTESDVKARGIPVLDLYLAQEAERMSKPTGAVEHVDEQCLPLNGLNGSQVLFALNQTLHQQESIRAGDGHSMYTTDDLIKHYNCGDLNAVIFNQDTAQQVPNLANATLPFLEQRMAHRIDAYFREELIFKRNQRMGERVIELLLANPDRSFFFAFGAGHFLGNNTVLDVLNKAGFLIDNIPANRKLKTLRKKSRGQVGLLPEFQILRDFTLTSNSLDEPPQPKARSYVQLSHNPRRRTHKITMPQRLASAPPSRKHRNFNDLWVRLDSVTTGKPHSLPHNTEDDEDALIVQRSLRIWYGLPTNAAAATVVHSLRSICLAAIISAFSYIQLLCVQFPLAIS